MSHNTSSPAQALWEWKSEKTPAEKQHSLTDKLADD